MEITKSAMVSVIGRPNTGKSTLLNAVVGRKIAITSPKPQTTRTRIMGVAERDNCQFVFVDTPGFHRPRTRLGECMVGIVRRTVAEVDCAVMVVEPTVKLNDAENSLIESLNNAKMPAVLVINKIDTVKKETLLEVISVLSKAYNWAAVVPLSAKTGEGVPILLEELAPFALDGGRLFPQGMDTDMSEKQLVAEIIREKLLYALDDEVPHGIAVDIESLSENDKGIVNIQATIYCERESHKGIIIGKRGAMLKRIGELARAELENFYNTKVFLQTWVKVKDNWRDSMNFIHNIGLDGE